MTRTDEQKYSAVLKELGDVLAAKGTTILVQEMQIDELTKKLAAAEAERDNARQDQAEMGTLVAGAIEAATQLRSVNKALHNCLNMENKTIVDWDGLIDLQQYIKTALQVLETGGAA